MQIRPEDVDQIAQWGMEAGSFEACGVLLARSDDGPRLKLLNNRSMTPARDTLIYSDDLLDALIELTQPPGTYHGDLTQELVVWHTHPGGHIGPSPVDLEHRQELGNTRCLVVTIPSGEAVEF
jgi:proteasome lid subunit RPN8/RPN11